MYYYFYFYVFSSQTGSETNKINWNWNWNQYFKVQGCMVQPLRLLKMIDKENRPTKTSQRSGSCHPYKTMRQLSSLSALSEWIRTPAFWLGMSNLATKLGQIRPKRAKIYLNLIWKNPRFKPFGVNLTQFGCQIWHPWW